MATAELILGRAATALADWSVLVKDVEVFLEPALSVREKCNDKSTVKPKWGALGKLSEKQLAARYGSFLLRMLANITTALTDSRVDPGLALQ
eukprot:Ihof_evm2s912 gene=Ihof_evmTU2s912